HKDGKAKTLYSFDELTGKVESRVYDDKGTLVRYNGKHLNDDSQYKTNIIFQLENKDDTVKNATDALANKHPKNSYIAKMDETGGIKIYDVDGNEVALNVNGKYRINVVGHGSSMKIMGADALSNRITALQAKLNIEQTDEGRIALVGCETDKPSSSGTAAEITSLAQLVAKRLYDSGNGTINAEVTGRTTQIEVNADGTKTMLTGGTKTVYSWDTDKGETTQRTEAVKSHSEKLENPLGGFDEYSKLLNELIQKEGKDGSNYNFLRKLEAGFQMTKVLESGILKTKNFERMANDLDRHLQVRNIKYQTQFDKLSAIARKCAENTLAYHLEDKFNKGELDVDASVDMLEDILGLSLEEQIRRIAGVKSEFERLLSKDEINLDQNAARKAWAEECVRDASIVVNGIT
ncbi:C80 family cysteine peptidase, partial [bacterium endosymbiont of Bathymodiolus sp. 5 South]|uniref:C80 family cysteine peptidase n=1 Tax=bacterium endosymbiont of Bathymodiolus sp. 5 South TaxID=1181670 RepID=UPI00111A3F48